MMRSLVGKGTGLTRKSTVRPGFPDAGISAKLDDLSALWHRGRYRGVSTAPRRFTRPACGGIFVGEAWSEAR